MARLKDQVVEARVLATISSFREVMLGSTDWRAGSKNATIRLLTNSSG